MNKTITDVLKRGRKQGFITYDMLNEIFGENDIREEDIEEIFRLLDSAGIPVIDSPNELQSVKQEKKAVTLSGDRDEGISYDPVDVYLADLSRYPRLESNEEIRIIEAMRIQKYALIDVLTEKDSLLQYLDRVTQRKSDVALDSVASDDVSAVSGKDEWRSRIRYLDVERLASAISSDTNDQLENLPDFIPFTEEALSGLRTALKNVQSLRRKLVEGHVRLVVSLAIKHQSKGVDFLDLVQDGNTGLIDAADHFDPDRDQSFGSYATWWIREAMNRAIREQSKVYRLSRSISTRLKKLNRARKNLAQRLERDPTPRELADEMETDEESIIRLMRVTRKSLRLDQPADTEDDAGLVDVLDLEKYQEDISAKKQMAGTLLRIIDTLDEREGNVIRLRFGIGDGVTHSVEQTAKLLGLSKDRVRELEERALMNLRHPSKRSEFESVE